MEIKKTAISLAVVAIVALVIFYMTATGYQGVSDNGYQLAKATYGACMARSEERLEKVEQLLEDQDFVAQMNPRELRWFRSIFKQARANRWQTAASTAKQIMEDQVVR